MFLGGKRKLSITAPEAIERKRSKNEVEAVNVDVNAPPADVIKPELEAADEDSPEEFKQVEEDDQNEGDGEEEAGDEGEDEDEEMAEVLKSPGPLQFYIWTDGLIHLVEMEICDPFVSLKTAVDDAYATVAHIPEDARRDAVKPHVDKVHVWDVLVEEDDRNAPAALAMRERLNEHMVENVAEERETGEFFVISMQRVRPEGKEPAVQVYMEGNGGGPWWLVDFQQAEGEDLAAIKCVSWYLESPSF